VIQCSTLNAIAMAAVHARCRIYQGWRDGCTTTSSPACTAAPSKWGYSTQDACSPGTGVDNTCGIHTLDLNDVRMFGLNTDGDVDDNDRLYYGFHCTDGTASSTTTTGSCPAGTFITSMNTDGSFVCTAAEPAIVSYMRSDCRLYTGWIDNCDGCVTASTRSGYVSHSGCTNLVGPNYCGTYNLSGTNITMFGLNTGGDVDGNDQLRMGFHCNAIADAPMSTTACASSQLATGVSGTSVTCNPAAARTDDYVRSSCSAYYGHRDNCDGCTSSPLKWGRVNSTGCQSGLGADNSCANYTLGGVTLPMFGLNMDGDVDGNDKLYTGLRCF
jgi:hypothetical protein